MIVNIFTIILILQNTYEMTLKKYQVQDIDPSRNYATNLCTYILILYIIFSVFCHKYVT